MEWIDPVSGNTISSETLNWKGGNIDLTTPPYSVDIAFRMKKIK
jgi:hypothetical protein